MGREISPKEMTRNSNTSQRPHMQITDHSAGREIQAHEPEPFWYIALEWRHEQRTISFTWDRGRLFDHFAALLFYEPCALNPEVTITQVLLPLLQLVRSHDQGGGI